MRHLTRLRSVWPLGFGQKLVVLIVGVETGLLSGCGEVAGPETVERPALESPAATETVPTAIPRHFDPAQPETETTPPVPSPAKPPARPTVAVTTPEGHLTVFAMKAVEAEQRADFAGLLAAREAFCGKLAKLHDADDWRYRSAAIARDEAARFVEIAATNRLGLIDGLTARDRALFYESRGAWEEAASANAAASALADALLPRLSPTRIAILAQQARLARAMGRSEALPRMEEAIAAAVSLYGADHPETAHLRQDRGLIYEEQGKLAAAAADFAFVVSVLEPTVGQDDPVLGQALLNLGLCELARRQPDAAADHLSAAIVHLEHQQRIDITAAEMAVPRTASHGSMPTSHDALSMPTFGRPGPNRSIHPVGYETSGFDTPPPSVHGAATENNKKKTEKNGKMSAKAAATPPTYADGPKLALARIKRAEALLAADRADEARRHLATDLERPRPRGSVGTAIEAALAEMAALAAGHCGDWDAASAHADRAVTLLTAVVPETDPRLASAKQTQEAIAQAISANQSR